MTGQGQPNWIQKHGKKLLLVGCIFMPVVCGGGVFALLSMVFGMIKSSPPYKEGLELASKHPKVLSQLGKPIEPGFLVSGNINYNDASGKADLAVPLSGPSSSGTLYIDAYSSGGSWKFQSLILKSDGQRDIDVLKK